MEIGTNTIDNLDFYEEEIDDNGQLTGNYVDPEEEKQWMDGQYPQEEPQATQETEPQHEDSLITRMLQDRGISDPSKIKFADENDQIVERSWDSLSSDEQYNILNNQVESEETDTNDLSEDEINLLNTLRSNQLSAEDFVNAIKQQAIQEYQQTVAPQEPVYEVDSISDDDLYVIDLMAKIPDITDEELASALENAKQNPELYQKQISGIRNEYKDLEQQNIDEQKAIAEQQEQDRYAAFSNQIFDSIDNLTEIGGLEISLDDEDKDEIAEFILGQDQAGINHLTKALNDPETLTKMAWFALKGQDILDGVVDYFTKEITRVRDTSYQEGLKAQKNVKKPQVVIDSTKRKNEPKFSQDEKISSVEDLDF